MHLLSSYGTGVLLAAFGAHALIVGVIIALLAAAIVGLVLYVLPPTRPYAGAVAVLVLIVLLLLELL
jgi:hypothetical protein